MTEKQAAAEGERDYALAGSAASAELPAPDLPYAPRLPNDGWRPAIGLVGCGGISEYHLKAYRRLGLEVAWLCDVERSRAEKRAELFPRAKITADAAEVFADPRVEIVDLATHPPERVGLIERAVAAGKHVLSQKPFVNDLDVGARLVELAAARGVCLAVNQNGRWAPHFAWMRHAVAKGLVGDVCAAHFAVHWDHDWVATTPFNTLRHVILYDFAVHWFDMLHCLFPRRPARRVFATLARSAAQRAAPPLLGQALVELDGAQASLVFDGHTRQGALDTSVVVGSQGTLQSCGPSLQQQSVTLFSAGGFARPRLEGTWFEQGFEGAMAELVSAIAERREPSHSARDNLKSLELVFAAIASAESGLPQAPGAVRRAAL